MAGNIRLQVVTPEKSVVDEDVQIIVAPGSLGEFGVLVGHTPFMSTLKLGTIRYRDQGGTERFLFVSGGFVEVLPGKVTVLAESAERRRDIDLERVKRSIQRAEERLSRKQESDIDFVRAKASLDRALHRLKLAQTRRAS
jgi:F-type H+-transporting ATPase subunit epsilon